MKNIMENIKTFDDIGVFTSPLTGEEDVYDLRALDRWCKEQNILIENTTQEQRDQFITKKRSPRWKNKE